VLTPVLTPPPLVLTRWSGAINPEENDAAIATALTAKSESDYKLAEALFENYKRGYYRLQGFRSVAEYLRERWRGTEQDQAARLEITEKLKQAGTASGLVRLGFSQGDAEALAKRATETAQIQGQVQAGIDAINRRPGHHSDATIARAGRGRSRVSR
jgi:hypothetical protein